MKRLLLAITFLVSFSAAAQTVNLLKDINTSVNAAGSSPSNFTNVGGVVFFTANDPERGTELWKTDGTLAGTSVVKDINQGQSSSSPTYLTAIGSTVYFSADDGINGRELWKSDGTDAGTSMVKDIYSGSSSSSPAYIIASGSNLYFAADNGTQGKELWKSDGTLGNTVQLTEIYSGATGSDPRYLTNANGTIYFRATHPSYGTELWKTTGGAPSLVEDIYAGASNNSSPYNLIALNSASSSVIFFVAYDPSNGYELWMSSGTAATTNLVSIYYTSTAYLCGLSICFSYDYTGSSSPDYFATTGTNVYFAATSSTGGTEVYRHDGTTLTLVQDFVAGTGSLNPRYLTNVNGTIFFSGTDASGDRELYKATTGAVSLVTNINTAASTSSSPSDFEATGTTVFFSATGSDGNELWKATTSSGAVEVANINNTSGTASSSPGSKAYIGGKLYLSANNGTSGAELWKSDGTGGGTVIVKDINGGTEDGFPNSIYNTGTTLYFAATATSTLGSELWKSDGTSIGTVAVADINNVANSSSSPIVFAYNNSLLHIRANTATKGSEFHVSTGAVGNVTLQEINTTDEAGSYPGYYGYATLGSSVYFSAYTPAAGYELFRSINGGAASLVTGGSLNSSTGLYAGTGSSYPQYLTVVGSCVYFSAQDDANGYELFRICSSTPTTIEATENLNISGNSYPQDLCAVGSTLYFQADNGSDGYELFKTTGTTITMVKTGGINSGSGNANPSRMTNVGGTLFFRAIDGTNGSELWKSDGTSAGTVMVKDINTTPSTGSTPNNLTAVGSVLYFTANESTYGTELYKSDGTLAGTTLVKDIFSGTASSSPSNLKNINGTLYFSASNGTGLNLMKTNGTTAGTIVATSAAGVVTYQGVSEIQYLNQNVIWVGTSNANGNELLYVKAEPLNQPASVTVNTPTAATLNVTWPTASGTPTGYLVARHTGGIPTGLPVDGVAPSLGTPLISGTGTVAYVGTSTNFVDTGLSPSTTYYYAVYSYNDGGSSVNIYKPHTPPTGNATTLAANPTTQAHTPFTSNVGTTSITFNWTSGNGSERIVLAKQSASVISDVPVDGTGYTANASFGSGSLIGTSRVVYRGTGTSVPVTGLTAGLQYQFIVFELNGTGTQTNYLTSIAGANGSATTLSGLGDQPTDLIFSSIGTNTISLSWSNATAVSSDNGYIVTRKAGSDPSAPGDVPINMSSYSPGSTIGTATVVYNTDDDLSTSFTDPINPVTMSAGTVYFYRIYAKSATTTYVTTAPLSGAQTTLAAEPTTAPGAISYTPGTTSMTGSFAAGTGATSYIVLQREAGVVFPDAPVDGQNYTMGEAVGSFSTVVYVGLSPGPFTSTGLQSNTLYYYAAFSAAGSGAAINYLTSSSSASSRATLVDEPTDQPSNLGFSNLAPTAVDVSFADAPNIPTGYIVLRNAGAPVSVEPVDGVAHLVNDVLSGHTVVHVGSGTSFSEAGLTSETTYHYAAFSYNGFGDSRNYLNDGEATGSIVTPALEPTAQPTSINFTARTTTSLSFTFNAAAGAPVGYIVLRSSGAAPAAEPTDGVEYTAGGSIGADVIVQVGSSTSVIDDNFGDELIEDTHYYYKVFSYNGSAGTYNYLPTTPLQGDHFTHADEPVDHPINMAFSSLAPTSMSVSFDEPAALPAGYLVIRKSGSAPLGTPVDGVAYVAGSSLIGGDPVIYIGSTPTFPSTGLVASTVYHYAVYPYKGSGVSSNFLIDPTGVPVLKGSRTSLQNEPIGQPTSLTFTNVNTSSAKVNFTASDASRYIVIRRAGSDPDELPDDGTAYADNTDIVLSKVTYTTSAANISTFTDGSTAGTAPMTPGTKYFYAIYGYNGTVGSPNANYLTTTPLKGSVEILAIAPSTQPTALNFTALTSTSLTGTFTAATGSPDGYVVVRKLGSAPTGPVPGLVYQVGDPTADGTVVHAGPGITFDDSNLIPGGHYYYRVYSYNGSAGSTNYFTSSPLGNDVSTYATEPNQPTSLNPGRATTSIDLHFTASNADHYLILRKQGSAPTEIPVDGTTYTEGAVFPAGTSMVVHADDFSASIIDSGLSPETVYYYAIFGYNGASGLTYNYNTVAPLSGSFSTLANEPSTIASGLNFSAVTVSGATVAFTAATGSPTGYIVIRQVDAAPTSTPNDGNASYAVGQDLADGKIVHFGPGVSFSETGLSAETTYHYQIYSYNGTGSAVNFLTSSSLAGSFTTLDTEPTQPTLFSSSNTTTTSASISMTLSGADHYLILRKAGSATTDMPVDGTEYSTGATLPDSKIVFAGDITLPVDDNTLSAGTDYHYTIFAYNGAGVASYNYNTVSPLTGIVSTTAAQPTAQPTVLAVGSVDASTATISFTAASGTPDGYLVVRKDGQAPTGGPVDRTDYVVGDPVGDGDVAYVGPDTYFGETNLLPETDYYYQVYSYNGGLLTKNYLLTSPLNGNFTTLDTEPAQPTAFVATNKTGNAFTINMTLSDAEHYIILRKADSPPDDIPVDGTEYFTNTDFDDSRVVFAGDISLPINETGLLPETVYYYAIYGYNGTSEPTYNYNTVSPLMGAAGTLAAEPTIQPTALTFGSVTASSATVSFTSAVGAPDGYLVVRKQGTPLSGPGPVDGHDYALDESLDGGNVVSVGPALSVAELTLSAETDYYYKVYAFNGSGLTSNFLSSSPLSDNFTTLDTEPAQPTGFTVTGTSTSTISISMTLSGADHYLILRKAGSAPTDIPGDGTGYATNDDLPGGSHVVLAGVPSLPITDPGLSPGMDYYYKVFAYNGLSATTYNYNTTAPPTDNASTHAVEPSAQPSLLTFANIGSTAAKVSFIGATGSPTGYLVIRRDLQVPSSGPVDGTFYNLDDNLGGGKVASVGAALTFDESNLTAQTEYFYQVYAYNGSGSTVNYLSVSPLSDSFTTLATEPSQPTLFTSSNVLTTTASISFTTSGAQHYLVLRNAGSAPSTGPTDGVGYTAGQTLAGADIIRAGTITLPINDTGLTPGTDYHYAIYAYNGTAAAATNNYNTVAPLSGIVNTMAAEPLAQATSMVFSAVTTGGMTVSFSASTDSPDGYLVVRKLNVAPSVPPTDGTTYSEGASALGGTIVHVGPELTFDDTGLVTESNYFYSVFAFNGSGQTTNYLSTSALTNSHTTLATEPSPATLFVASNINATSLSISFTESANAQHYLILRKAVTAPGVNEIPVDGVGYTTSQQIGTSDVVFAGDITTLPIAQSGLTSGTVYHYKIFTYNGSTSAAYNYNTSAPLAGVTGTRAAEPTSQATGVSFDDISSNGATVVYLQASGSPDGYLVIRRQDAAPTATPTDGTSYSVDQQIGTGNFVAYVGPDLSFAETVLTAAKTYHYRVFSFNGDQQTQQTINYLTTSPGAGSFTTLAIEPTTQPSTIVFSSVQASSFTVSFTAATTPVAGYIAVRKVGADPSTLPADGTTYNAGDDLGDGKVAFVGGATTFNESLTLASYHYAIYSFSGSGLSINYKTDNPPKATLPIDSTGPEITNNTGTSLFFGADLVVKYTITDAESGIRTTPKPQLFYRPLTDASTDNFSQKDLTLTGGFYQATLTPAEVEGLGLDYYVIAENTAGVSTTSPTEHLRVSFSGSTSIPTLDGGQGVVADFHIVAVPLELSDNAASKVFSSLKSEDNGTGWRMFRWNGTKTEEFTDLTKLDIEPGKGYWLISKADVPISPGVGLAVAATDLDPFEIPLTSGWNQIGNPYLFNLWWDDIVEANPQAGSLPLRLFNGSEATPFRNGDILPVFEGGFTQVGAATTISIPTIKNVNAGRGTSRKPKTHALDSDDWEVIIGVQNGGIKNPFGGVGMSRDANESYDQFDDFNLPRFMDYVELNHPKRVYGMVYTKDIIPLEESHIWEFSIDASTEGVTLLTWDNTYFGANDRQIILWDEEEQLATDMRKENSYSFVLHVGRKFKIFFGNKEFVEEQAAANTVRIHSISPNPTQADVTVEFSMPGQDRSHVNVHVLNNMGQPIATVFDGEIEAGHHTMQWSGTDVHGLRPAAGVYLIEVINDERRTSKRLVIK